MHFTFFSVKRIYMQGQHKVLMPIMKKLALTPARFDVMLILNQMAERSFMYQCMLRRWLGTSRSAVSQLAIKLEKLGYISRARAEGNNKQPVMIRVTKRGRRVIRRALKALKLGRRGPAMRTAHTVFLKRWWASRRNVLEQVREIDAFFRRIRHVVSDDALLVHPWDPEQPADVGLPPKPVTKPELWTEENAAQAEASRWKPHSSLPRKPNGKRWRPPRGREAMDIIDGPDACYPD